MKKKFAALSLVMILIDLSVKTLVQKGLGFRNPLVVIPGFFNLDYYENTGAAWSILEGHSWFFIVVASVVSVGLMFYFFKEDHDIVTYAGISLIFAGTFGNLFDRIFHGAVRDMFAFNFWGYHFPIFNVADACLVIGVGLIALQVILEERSQKHEKNNN